MSRPPAPCPPGAVEQVQLAVQWALLHPCRRQLPATWGGHPVFGETAPLAGPGAPLVDEYAPASLAAALGITPRRRQAC